MTDISHATAIILAAGRGTRMQAKTRNKVTFKLSGKPMIAHTVNHIIQAGIEQIIAVVGFQAQSVRSALGTVVTYAVQVEQKGTGDAVKTALPLIKEDTTTVLTIYGDDSAFYPSSLYHEMVHKLDTSNTDVLFLTLHKQDPTGLGRIVRDKKGQVVRIVEEKNATDEEKKIKEINTGFYCFKKEFLSTFIHMIEKNPILGEYYLTDLIEIALKHGKSVEALLVPDDSIWYGINNRTDFARARKKVIL